MILTITKDDFNKNFSEDDNRYVGPDIDWTDARNWDFTKYPEIVEEIREKMDNEAKINRMKNVIAVCFNILSENGENVKKIHSLQDVFNHFEFFKATTSKKEIYYECPCTQPELHELDWFCIKETDRIFYVGSECVNKFGDENFRTEHEKMLKLQLVKVKIDALLREYKTDKNGLIHFCKFEYPEICGDLRQGNSLTKPQIEKLQILMKSKWQVFANVLKGSNAELASFALNHRHIFKKYSDLVDEQYRKLFLILLNKRKLSVKQIHAIAINVKKIIANTEKAN